MSSKKEYSRCLRCGRRLKKQEYRIIGYGPVCYEKSKKNKSIALFTISDK